MAAAARSASRLKRRLGARAFRFAGWAPGRAAAKVVLRATGQFILGAEQPGQSCRAGLAMEKEAGLGGIPFGPCLALGQAAAAPVRGKMAARARPPRARRRAHAQGAPRRGTGALCRSLLSPAPRLRVGSLHRSRS